MEIVYHDEHVKVIKHPYTTRQRIEFLAYETIRGTFGDFKKRKKALGGMYEDVQTRVNQIYKEAGRIK